MTAAAAQIDLTNLPALTGSDQQIEWATALRAKLLAPVAEEIAAGNGLDDAELEAEFVAWLTSRTESRFWIDARTQKGVEFDHFIDLFNATLD